MLYWAIQTAIMSIILIFLVHHLISFFTLTLTVPKIKDLVNTSTQKYEHMFNVISNANANTTPLREANDYTLLDLIPKTEDNSMKSELKNFLKKQLNNTGKNVASSTEISEIDSIMGTTSYSTF
jgi:predicted PurR-regulated permease PerM